MKKVLLAAFILRIIIAPLGEHGDVINYYYWAMDLGNYGLQHFYERSIANAMPPTYPPVTSYLFWMMAGVHSAIWKVLWIININIHIFPSNIIHWFESPKGWYFVNKLPSIIADIGIIYLLNKFVTELKNKKAGIIAASLFAFVPVFWYNSALWGQTDSIFALPMLASLYYLHKRKPILSFILFLLGVLTKPTAVFILPIYAIWWLKKAKKQEVIQSVILAVIITFLIYWPFHTRDTLKWIFNFYSSSLGGELDYLVANAFNLWGLIFGFDNRPEYSLLLGSPSHVVGYILYAVTVATTLLSIRRKKLDTIHWLLLSSIVAFLGFLFLPRMHERYFYPVLITLIPVVAVDKSLRRVFYILSLIHLVNLYHFWWVPRVEFLIKLLSNRIVEQLIILINFVYFYKLVGYFKISYEKK